MEIKEIDNMNKEKLEKMDMKMNQIWDQKLCMQKKKQEKMEIKQVEEEEDMKIEETSKKDLKI